MPFDYANEYLRRIKADKTPGTVGHAVVPHLRCAKGLTISLQASRTHYCEPKSDTGPWTHVEVMSPKVVLRSLMPYREARDSNLSMRVPVDAINRLITHHGGIVEPIIVLPPPKTPGVFPKKK